MTSPFRAARAMAAATPARSALLAAAVSALAACNVGDRTASRPDTTYSAGGDLAAAARSAPPDQSGSGLTALDLSVSDDEYRRWSLAQRALDTIPGLPVAPRLDADHLNDAAVAKAEAYLQNDARAKAALDAAGITPHDYVLTSVALDQALVSATRPRHPRYQRLPDGNVVLVRKNQADLEQARYSARYPLTGHPTDTLTADEVADSAAAVRNQSIASAGIPLGSAPVIGNSGAQRAESVATATSGGGGRSLGTGYGTGLGGSGSGSGVGTGVGTGIGGAGSSASAAPAARIVPSGTTITLKAGDRVCMAGRAPGFRFPATITAAVTGPNGTLIPAGSPATVVVTRVTRGDSLGQGADIDFVVTSFAVAGASYPVDAPVTSSQLQRTKIGPSNKRRTEQVVAGAVIGAVAGQVIGKDTKGTLIGAAAGAAGGAGASALTPRKTDTCLPSGGRLTAELPNAVRLRA